MGDGRKAAYEREEEEYEERMRQRKELRLKNLMEKLNKRPDLLCMLVDRIDESYLILHRLQLYSKPMALSDHEQAEVLRNKLHELSSLTSSPG